MYYTTSESTGPGITMVSVSIRSIAVTGMSCDHCASAVRAEISKLPGVTGVDVDVAAGTVRVSGDPVPGDASLREAVEEAGYELAD
jgi:copper chaperone